MNAYIVGGRLGDFIHTLYVPATIYHTQQIAGDVYLTEKEEYGASPFQHSLEETIQELRVFINTCAPYIKNVYVLEQTSLLPGTYRSILNLNEWRKLAGSCEWLLLLHDIYQVPIHGNPWCTPSPLWERPLPEYVVFHRSLRRHNPTFPWETILQRVEACHKKAIFVTCDMEEYMYFPLRHKIPVQLCKDITEMARWIHYAEFVVGNQSAPMALSLSLGKKSIVEIHVEAAGDMLSYINTTMSRGEVYCYLNECNYRRLFIG